MAADPCSYPQAPEWRGAGSAQVWRGICDRQRQQKQLAADAQRQQADAQVRQQKLTQESETEQDRAIQKAVARGYKETSVKNLLLDGKSLADDNAKVQVQGIYKGNSSRGIMYVSFTDAAQDNDNYILALADDAQRTLREKLLGYQCESGIGCQIDVGGHMTMCEHFGAMMAGSPPVPCLNIEVEIVYRPGD